MWLLGWTILSVIVSSINAVPQWINTYSVKGTITIPYAEIKEPFSAWFDGTNKQSRIDYYGDMVQTYQLGRSGYGTSIKVAPITTETETNVKTCLQVNGTEDYSILPQSVLPDLTGFTYLGKELIESVEADKWNLTTVVGERENRYIIWLIYKEDVDSGVKVTIPIRYEMRGFNSLLGSHYDHYYLRYSEFDNQPIDDVVFQIPSDLVCQSFPGPGDRHIATFNPMQEFIYPEHTEHIVDFEFDKFQTKHGKQYGNFKETAMRREIFRQNLRFVHSHNRKNVGYFLTINHLADKNDQELKALRGRQYTGVYNGGLPFPHTENEYNQIPSEYDWRLYGAVTPVKDQSICGSCWSFGTVGTIEGALFLRNGGHLIRLSQQALIDCSWGFGNNGCDGGEDFRAYQWMAKHGGIPTEEDYGPYLGQDGYCHVDKVPKVAKLSGWYNVTSNDENALRLAIFKHGPISVAIDASHKTFSFYSNGVYYDETCGNKPEQLDHAVLAVGYGTLRGKNYWLVKNSWSTYWGNDGYVLMSSDKNNCGVMTDATYVTIE